MLAPLPPADRLLNLIDDHIAPRVELKHAASASPSARPGPPPSHRLLPSKAHSPLQPRVWDCCDATRDVVCRRLFCKLSSPKGERLGIGSFTVTGSLKYAPW